MKLGIFSDVHANLEALKAVIELFKEAGVNRYICCGDVVGYGADPNKCVELVRGMKPTCVAGNHDYGVVGRVSAGRFNEAAAAALAWTREKLTASNRLWIENLPLTDRVAQIFAVHASPSEPDEWSYILSQREADDEMEFYPEAICLVGHSHYPFVAERLPGKRAAFVRTETVPIKPDARYLINVGSVGQPRDGDARACCMVYDLRAASVTFHRVSYDVAATQKKIRAAGLPDTLATRLSRGR